MTRRDKRMLLAGVAMLAACPAALALRPGRVQPAVPAVELETVLPLAFDGWRVDPRLTQTVALGETQAPSPRAPSAGFIPMPAAAASC